MNKRSFLLRFMVTMGVFALAMLGKSNAQCAITAPVDGCVGTPVGFCATGPDVSGADSIVWDFGGTLSSRGTCVSPLFTAPTGGPIVVTLKVYKNGAAAPICTKQQNLTVHALPIANFVLDASTPTPQCFNGNLFCFKDNTTTPSGNPIVWREFVPGDGAVIRDSTAIGMPTLICHSYKPPTPAGGFFDPNLKIRDSKGCIAFVTKTALISVKPDIGADFFTPQPQNCDSTPVIFTNTSLISQPNAKSYKWDFGDGNISTTDWSGFRYVYRTNGCFNAKLIVESNDGCFDTAQHPAACNVKVSLNVSVSNGDVQCFEGQNFIFNHPVIQGASFLWVFDDPNSGNLNTDQKSWNPGHDFTGVGPYNVEFHMAVAGCQFDTVYRVHVKGPAAAIESKSVPSIIAPSQRYQCKITDTVYFTNNSTYYFNDDSAFNDFYYTFNSSNAIFQLISKTTAHIDFDTFSLSTGIPQNFVTKTGRQVYVSASGDKIAVNGDTLLMQGTYLRIGDIKSLIDKFHTNDYQVTRVWDFGDQQAPKCTTDSRYIYPIDNAKYKNGHFPGPLAPANTYNAAGKWINCNFSKDSLPKHWYTPGYEQCYTVVLRLKDTSKNDPNIQGLTASGNDPAGCESSNTVQLALQGPDARGLRWSGIPCYGNPQVYGFFYDFSKTGPACDRQNFWIHLDSLTDRNDITPNIFDRWIPQNQTVVDRFFTPWTSATQSLPPNVGRIFWQYSASAVNYPQKIADPAGWVTLGFRIQNGIDPLTGQPCIDEKWYHNAYRYINSNAEFKFYRPDKPDSLYTFERFCNPYDIYVKRDSTVLDALKKTYTYVSDSAGVDIWLWGDDEVDIDSFHRYIYDPVTNKHYSYIISWHRDVYFTETKTDSILTRIYDPVLGKTTFVDVRDSVPQIYRQHRYNRPRRNVISHYIIPCQWVPLEIAGTDSFVYYKSCCDIAPEIRSHSAVGGFVSDLLVKDTIVCRNTVIQFYDTARYFLEFPQLFPPLEIDVYDYWETPTQYSDGSPRFVAAPNRYETIRWDFGEGLGWNASVPQNPARSYAKPGIYDVKIEYTDSVSCVQVNTRRITVTGVSANFTFNRALQNCRPTVDFLDTSLMLDPCVLVNGTTCDEITEWHWDFGDNKPNNQSQSAVQNPSKIYTSFGDFDIKLVVKTKLNCYDSITRTITLEGPRPKFEFAADSVGCVPFTVEFRNTSINPTSNAEWTWYFGDNDILTTRGDTNVVHTYDSAGVFEVFLIQSDNTPLGTGKCNALYPDTNNTFGQYRRMIVRVLPTRKVDFNVSDSVICKGDSVTFTSNSDTIYTTFRWILGTDTTVKDTSNNGQVHGHKFDKTGTFYMQLRPLYTPPPGEPTCVSMQAKPIYVREVVASFLCDTTQKPTIYFTNTSTNYQDIWWDFGTGNGFESGNSMPTFPNAQHNYGENRGTYTVLLAVRSPEGCLDTAYCIFNYEYITVFNPPNVFTPGDGNSLNDLFDVKVQNEETYDISIYNRWGEKVFEADNKDTQWDGKHRATGADCPPGVYYVVINYRLRGEKDNTYRGTLTLIRK